MVNKNVLSCLLKDGKEVNAVMLVGRLFHARAKEISPLVSTKLFCLVTEAHRCKWLVPVHYTMDGAQPGLKPMTCESQVRCPANSTTASPSWEIERVKYIVVVVIVVPVMLTRTGLTRTRTRIRPSRTRTRTRTRPTRT